jgi:hypothetical protein
MDDNYLQVSVPTPGLDNLQATNTKTYNDTIGRIYKNSGLYLYQNIQTSLNNKIGNVETSKTLAQELGLSDGLYMKHSIYGSGTNLKWPDPAKATVTEHGYTYPFDEWSANFTPIINKVERSIVFHSYILPLGYYHPEVGTVYFPRHEGDITKAHTKLTILHPKSFHPNSLMYSYQPDSTCIEQKRSLFYCMVHAIWRFIRLGN